MTRPVRIVVVGGGAAGVLVAARLLDASIVRPLEVTVVEASGRLGAGVAYGTDDPDHLVNVRASGMSADPSSPDDLVQWLAAGGLGDGDTFATRRSYRRYLQAHLRRSVEGAAAGSLDVVADRVVALTPRVGSVDVELASGRRLSTDHVVLATGNAPPAVPEPLRALEGHAGWVPDPWRRGALLNVRPGGRVLLVGTGLTMVDVAITLGRRDVTELVALSRRGELPRGHLVRQPARPLHVIDLERDSRDVLQLRDRLRARIVDGVDREYPDEDWREVVDAVRPFANALWRRFDDEQRRILLSAVLREWDVHRHRMAPDTARRLDLLRRDRQLRAHHGRVVWARDAGRGRIRTQVELDGVVRELCVDAVVNCTGPGASPPTNPVLADLVARGLVLRDPLGLGLLTVEEGSVVGRDGRVQPAIHVVGPPRRGTLFETTAIPEVRSQALHVADRIVVGDAIASVVSGNGETAVLDERRSVSIRH